jgi:hypothetical protein
MRGERRLLSSGRAAAIAIRGGQRRWWLNIDAGFCHAGRQLFELGLRFQVIQSGAYFPGYLGSRGFIEYTLAAFGQCIRREAAWHACQDLSDQFQRRRFP